MKNRIQFLFLLAFSISLLSCSASYHFDKEKFEQGLNTWLNSDKTELIKSWGPPSRVESDMNGGQIYIYEKSVDEQTSGYIYTNPKYGLTTYKTPQDYSYYMIKMMYINSSGKIYHWRYDTNID